MQKAVKKARIAYGVASRRPMKQAGAATELV
jgi:hypothetical protein